MTSSGPLIYRVSRMTRRLVVAMGCRRSNVAVGTSLRSSGRSRVDFAGLFHLRSLVTRCLRPRPRSLQPGAPSPTMTFERLEKKICGRGFYSPRPFSSVIRHAVGRHSQQIVVCRVAGLALDEPLVTSASTVYVSCDWPRPPMLCARCQKNEATVHVTTVVDSARQETFDLCAECASAAGFPGPNLADAKALSVIGKKCDICGAKASVGQSSAQGPACWCYDCGLELGRIVAELCASEHPDLFKRFRKQSFLEMAFDPELRAWSEAAHQEAIQLLKERRRQDGRDKES